MAHEDEIRELRNARTQAQSRKVRAQVELDAATASKAEAAAVLKELGITSADDAKRVQKELEDQLEQVLQEARASLEEAGA